MTPLERDRRNIRLLNRMAPWINLAELLIAVALGAIMFGHVMPAIFGEMM